MNPFVVVARWLVRPLCRLVVNALAGYRVERDEMKLRHPSVRVVDIGEVTIDLYEERHRQMVHAEIGELRDFAAEFQAWSVEMWAGRNAKTIARRQGWSS